MCDAKTDQLEYQKTLPDEKRNSFREREKIYRKKYRDGLSEDIRELIRKKDNQSKKKKREADKPPKRPFTDKEKFYLKPEPFESLQRQSRLKPVECAGSYIKYLFITLQENIEQNGDWKWMYNTTTKETIFASEFETMAKKYAIVFRQLGLRKGDIVHFFLKFWDYAHTYPALAGLWIIGAVGSFGNYHNWINTHTTYQTEWARGKDRYKSELQLEMKQVYIKVYY